MRQPVVSNKCAEGELLYPGLWLLKRLTLTFALEQNLSTTSNIWEFSSCLIVFLGDQDGDWACDCRPTFVYHPQSGKCYAAFSKGPCRAREILILPQTKSVPVCQQHTCNEGEVRFNNRCSTLESTDACPQPSKGVKNQRLVVNATTLQLQCTFLAPRGDGIVIDEEAGIYESNHCFPGGKRNQTDKCQSQMNP